MARFLMGLLGTDQNGLRSFLLGLMFFAMALFMASVLASCLVKETRFVGGIELENPLRIKLVRVTLWMFAALLAHMLFIVLPVLWALGPRR